MFKTISGSKLADRSKAFFSRLDSLARKTKLIVRFSPKFSAEGFTLGVFKAVLTGKASFNQLARSLALSEHKAMTRQAVHSGVDKTAVAFMISATGEAIKDRWDDQSLIVTKRFNRVIIEDSSQAKTDKAMPKTFPHMVMAKARPRDARSTWPLIFSPESRYGVPPSGHRTGPRNRQGSGGPGQRLFDLVLRDMGYFGTAEFSRIELRDAFWLSRLPVSVKAYDLEGSKLETILRTTKAKEIDCNMSIGDVCHPARLIAVRATPEVARERRRLRREQARQLGKQPTGTC